MKKILLVLQLATVASLIISCKSDKNDKCDCCRAFTSVEKQIAGVTLKIPSAFTPKNYDYVDSILLLPDGSTKEIGIRKNPDTVYNYPEVNDKFQIEGLENFPHNKLIIRVPGDTVALFKFFNYGKVGETVWEGRSNGSYEDTLKIGVPIKAPSMIQSGRYEYILMLYKDDYYQFKDSLNNKGYNTRSRIDSIHGYFCIIRSKDYCNLGCKGAQTGDPLIK